MPHQCVKCNTLYKDGASEIINGCKCGGKLFFFIKREKLDNMKEMAEQLSKEEKQQIEEDIFDIMGVEKEQPVVLDLESIRILQPGKYEIDLVHLLKKDPLIYRIGEGKYIIDLIHSFRNILEKRKAK